MKITYLLPYSSHQQSYRVAGDTLPVFTLTTPLLNEYFRGPRHASISGARPLIFCEPAWVASWLAALLVEAPPIGLLFALYFFTF